MGLYVFFASDQFVVVRAPDADAAEAIVRAEFKFSRVELLGGHPLDGPPQIVLTVTR